MSGFHQKLIMQLLEVLNLMNSKMNSIHNFFLEILQRDCKLAILGTLGMLDHTIYQQAKNQLRPSSFP